LPAGTVGTAYAGSVAAIGALGATTYSLASGALPASGDLVLNAGTGAITGTPEAADVGTYNFTVKVVDQYGDTATSGNLSITVNPVGGTIAGQLNLQNSCAGVNEWPALTVTLTNTLTSQTLQTTTDSSAEYSFSSVPAGAYTITPSIPGATSSLFSPASYTNVVITNGSTFNTENFSAVVGYTVSGTVSYSGSQTGQTYLALNGGCNYGNGTSITEATLTSSGAYSIRNVAPGDYTVNAWMDSTGITSGTDYPGPQGSPNTNNPTGSSSSFTVNGVNVGGVSVSLSDPAFAPPPSNPSITVLPQVGGVLLSYNVPTVSTTFGYNNVNQEAANEYAVNWAVSDTTDGAGPICSLGGGSDGKQFLHQAGTHTFYATGNNSNLWILNNTSMGSGSFTAGGTYCFQARAFNTLASTTYPSGAWATQLDSDGNPQGVTLPTTTVFCTTNCTTVSGAITIPAGVTIAAGAPLYIGIYQQSSNSKGPSAIYSYEIPPNMVVSGGSGNSYSMTIPNGSGYTLFGILDQNNDGVIDAYDVTNTRNNGNSSGFTVSGTPVTQNLTLPSANSTVQVQTQYFTSSFGPSYTLYFQLNEANKLPVSVTLSNTSVATPYVMTPVDLSLDTNNGSAEYEYYAFLPGGTPGVGDSFDFTVTYSDGSQDTGTTVNGAVTAFGSTGAVAGASDAATNLLTTAGTRPNFSWTDSANAIGNGFYYSFYIEQQSGQCPSDNCLIWQIPGNNSNSSGFSSSTTSLTWGTDPTGGGSMPTGNLNPSHRYEWIISVQDSNGNQAETAADDNNP
jgi:hypothetical protein